MHPDIEDAGLSKDQIQTDVELKLRLAGITVLTREEWVNGLGGACLHVNVGSLKSSSYAFSIGIGLSQLVYLVRDPSIMTFGFTWRKGHFGTVGASNVNQLRDPVKDYVDEFINDYLYANPH